MMQKRLTYDKFYHQHGIRHLADIPNPPMINFIATKLPMYSIIHYYDNINKEIEYTDLIKAMDRYVLFNVIKYNPIYTNYRELPLNETKVVKELNKKGNVLYTPSYKLKIYLKNKLSHLKNEVLVYNYSHLNDYYKYSMDVLNKYYIYSNTYNTICSNIKELIDSNSKLPIRHYIYISVPDMLYGIQILNKYMGKEPTTEMLRVLHNEKYLLLLDIFRLFTKHKEMSILYQLASSVKYSKNVDLIFNYRENNIVINLKELLSYSKEYNYDNTKVNETNMLHMLLNMLSSLIESHKQNDIDIKDIRKELQTTTDIELLKKSLNEDVITEDEIDMTDDENIDNNTIKEINDESVIISDVEYINRKVLKDKRSLMNEDDFIESTNDVMDELLDNKVIDKKKRLKVQTFIDEFVNKKSPFDSKSKIKDILEYDIKDIDVDDVKAKIDTNIKVVKNKNLLSNRTGFIEKEYTKNELKNDIVRTLVSLQKTGIIIKDIDIVHTDNILGEFDTMTIEVSDKGGSNYKIPLLVPTIKENGTYVLSGNRYLLKKQRNELPIKKISSTRVVLSSATGKVNILKAPITTYDKGYKIRTYINKLNMDNKVSKLLLHTGKYMDINVPNDYYVFGRYIKKFTINGYTFSFDYNSRDSLVKTDLEKIEKDGVLVGVYKNKPVIMRYDNRLYVDDKEIGDLYSIIELDRNFMTEYTFINVLNTRIPVGIILTYYLGLNKLLEILEVEYEVLDGNKRIYDTNAVILKTDGNTVVIKITNENQRMILEGLNHNTKILKNTTIDILNNKKLYKTIFKELEYNLATITKIDMLEQTFVDAVTKKALLVMGEPTTFIGLLFRGTELLVDDKYEDPTNIETSLVKGYDRIPQYIHKVLTDAITKKRNAEYFGSSAKLSVNPYEVWTMLNEDAAGELVDDLNPIAYIKQKEDVTYLGTGGRSKESMPVNTRGYNPSDVGVISESVKDNTDVGITAYLSANPMFNNLLGMSKGKPKDLDYVNIYSTNTMLTPFLLVDDPKRIIYSAIQASGLIPIDEPILFPVRTPYANVLVYKMDKNFADFVTEEGVVKKVSKHSVTIEFKSGKKTYKFQDWTSKEESNSTYIHRMVTNLKEGTKVEPGDVVYYDSGFFEADMFDPYKVVYRTGRPVLTTMISSEDTREDSFVISDRLHKSLASSLIVIRDVTLTKDDNIKEILEVGSKVTSDDILFTIASDLVGDEKLDKETMDLLQGFVKDTPKTNNNGIVVALKVFYNCEYKELSRTLKKLVDMSKKYMVDNTTGKEYEGKVNSSYSINGKPLVEGGVHIKYYIETRDSMNTGDKGIFANQLKATVTTVADYKMVNEVGEEYDAKLDFTGIYNRIVPSAELLGTTAKVLEVISKKAVEMYFGK